MPWQWGFSSCYSERGVFSPFLVSKHNARRREKHLYIRVCRLTVPGTLQPCDQGWAPLMSYMHQAVSLPQLIHPTADNEWAQRNQPHLAQTRDLFSSNCWPPELGTKSVLFWVTHLWSSLLYKSWHKCCPVCVWKMMARLTESLYSLFPRTQKPLRMSLLNWVELASQKDRVSPSLGQPVSGEGFQGTWPQGSVSWPIKWGFPNTYLVVLLWLWETVQVLEVCPMHGRWLLKQKQAHEKAVELTGCRACADGQKQSAGAQHVHSSPQVSTFSAAKQGWRLHTQADVRESFWWHWLPRCYHVAWGFASPSGRGGESLRTGLSNVGCCPASCYPPLVFSFAK